MSQKQPNPYPITSQSLALFMFVERTLQLSSDQAAHFARTMWAYRSWGDRIFGPPFAATLDLAPRDPREALDLVGTALLSQQSSHRQGSAWQVTRRIHPAPGNPGAFAFAARSSYLWFPEGPGFLLSFAYLDARATARLRDDASRLSLSLVFQDEWAWSFDQSRREAEAAWRVVLNDLVRTGTVIDVVKPPVWPAPGPYRCPYLAAEPHVNRAQELKRQGNFAGAVAAYTDALAIDPWSPTSLGNRAVSYLMLGDLPHAVEDATRSIEIDPNEAGNYANRSEALRGLGQLKAALDDAETAVRLNPVDPGALVVRARILAVLNRQDEARADYRKALQLNPQFVNAQMELARMGG